MRNSAAIFLAVLTSASIADARRYGGIESSASDRGERSVQRARDGRTTSDALERQLARHARRADTAQVGRYSARDAKTGRFMTLGKSRALVPMSQSRALVPVATPRLGSPENPIVLTALKVEPKTATKLAALTDFKSDVAEAKPASVKRQRYDVRDPKTGRFMKVHAPMREAANVEAAPAKQKGTLSGWLRNNFTVRSEVKEQLGAAKTLGKAGQLAEAKSALEATPAPRGLFEKLAVGRAERTLARSTNQKVEVVEAAPKRSSANASAALKSARRAASSYDLDSAYAAIAHAEQAGASKNDLARAYADLERTAVKQAKAYSSHGMLDEALAALEHAHGAPGSTMRDEDSHAILAKAAAVGMKGNLVLARRYMKAGRTTEAAQTMLKIERAHDVTGLTLAGRRGREAGRLATALAPEFEKMENDHAEQKKAQADREREHEELEALRAAARSGHI